ncbi:hypothetical protein F4801DRAFT_582236 [Xylaria longipes]|nr:hypothetical protein F4801DRAFT_582236 [Xylaria longipes]
MGNVILMLMKDIEENLNAIGAPGDSLAVLERIFVECWRSAIQDPNIVATMIEWAWKCEYRSLYIKSVFTSMCATAGYGSREKGMKTVAKIINADISETKDKTSIQWDKYLGDAIDGIKTLTNLTPSLTAVETALMDSLKPAFSTWRTAAEQTKFDSIKCLDMEEPWEQGFISSRLDNLDWVTDCNILKVSKPQGKEFEEDLQEYNREGAEFERPFLALRHEYMKGLLGDAVYRELVMLEGVRDSEGAKQLASADETLENQTTVKPRQD